MTPLGLSESKLSHYLNTKWVDIMMSKLLAS